MCKEEEIKMRLLFVFIHHAADLRDVFICLKPQIFYSNHHEMLRFNVVYPPF